MLSRPTALVVVALLFGANLLFAFPYPDLERNPDGTAKTAPPEDKKQPLVGPPAPVTGASKLVDALRLPPDAILIPADQAADVLKMIPKYVILSPEKWQKYLDDIARLQAQLDSRKNAMAPSSLRLKGKLADDLLTIQAQFRFGTEAPGTVVNLACSPAFAGVGAQLDGRAPLLECKNGTFTVLVDKPGDHQLTLDLTLPAVARGDGRGFELDLPRAAITEVELELPNVKDVRRDDKPVGDRGVVTFVNGRFNATLGPADKLDLRWKDAGATTNLAPVQLVQGNIQVQIDDRETLIRAGLTLKVEGGQTNAWNLLVPVGAIVQVAREDESRVLPQVEQMDQNLVSLRTLRLKEPSGEPLNVTITFKGPPPRAGAVVPVGPYAVVGAQRQSGTITVSGSLNNQRLLFTKRNGTEELRQADDDPRPVLKAYRYATVALTDKPQAAVGPASLSLLDIEAESIHGLIEAQVAHGLRLQRDDKGRRFWHCKTTIEARPIRPGADHVDVLMPPGCAFNEAVGPSPAALIRHIEADIPLVAPSLGMGAASAAVLPQIEPDALSHVLRLNFGDQPKPFFLTIEVDFTSPVNESGEATLLLPRPLGMPDRGGQVTVAAQEDVELLPPRADTGALRLEQGDLQQQMLRSDRFPEQVHIHWQLQRPRVRTSALIDLTFTPREVMVHHRLRYHFPGAVPSQVAVVVPEEVASQFHVVGNSDIVDVANPHLRLISIKPPSAKEEPATLELEYSFPLPAREAGEPFAVPLVVPDQIALGDTKVRAWGDLGATPSMPPAHAGWAEQSIEVVKDNPRLPALVLLAHSPDAALSLRLDEPPGGGLQPAAVLVDRALIRVSVSESGMGFRASFLLTQLAARDVDIEFPAPVIGLQPRVLLDGKEVEKDVVDESGRRADGGRFARLRLSPSLVRRPVVLEISYHLPPGRAAAGPMQTTLQPPVIHGDTGHAQIRWLVALPSNLIVLGPEGGPGSDLQWSWQGWLPTPRSSLNSADLERWFADGSDASQHDNADVFVPSFVCVRNSLDPVTLFHAPRQAWLLVCSLGLLACGLGLFLLIRPAVGSENSSTTNWVGVTATALLVLVAAAVVGQFFLPTLMAAVLYGCLPGLAVLAVALAAHLLLHERHRRQIVFLPSFARGRRGSSIVRRQGGPTVGPRSSSGPVVHGEPSTVDLPPAASSNPRPLGDLLRTEEAGSSK